MAFTYIHSADWQIGKTFGGFAADKGALLKHARLAAIDRLAEAARSAGARDVVVCGDVFDSPGLADRSLREALARLANHPDVVWHLLPGNHDPARDGGVWHRLAALGLPANVRPLLASEPQLIAPGVFLLPAPLLAKAVSSDPTAWMDGAVTPAGAIRIGVAHGSTQGFGSAATASVGIAPGRRVTAQLDYLALGDWHGVREVAAGVWYCGTPEPDQFPDNEPGFALSVAIDGAGAAPRISRIATATYTWIRRTATVSAAADLSPIEAEVAAFGAAKPELLLELTLRGTVSLETDTAIAARLSALEASIFYLALRRDDLVLDTAGGDIAGISDAQIARVAAKLDEMRASPERRAVAEGALRRLFSLARQAEGQRS